MKEQILIYDRQLFKFINRDLSNSFFDGLMPWLRNATLWVPLYLFLILFVLVNFKKNAWWWIFFAALTVCVTNYVSSDLMKHNIIRLRPCNNPAFSGWIHVLVGYKPQSSSFTSSHAANHFAMAMFLFTSFKKYFGRWLFIFFFWAFSISFAQIYVGVHYPVDILAGGSIGILIGYLCGKFFNTHYGL
jgi:membrane-associated phospholipid phosphatase